MMLAGPGVTVMTSSVVSMRALPLEFRMLGYDADPWTPADSIAVGLLITRDQDDNWKDLLLRADLGAKVGASAARALTDNQIGALEDYLPAYAPAKPQHQSVQRRRSRGIRGVASDGFCLSASFAQAKARLKTLREGCPHTNSRAAEPAG